MSGLHAALTAVDVARALLAPSHRARALCLAVVAQSGDDSGDSGGGGGGTVTRRAVAAALLQLLSRGREMWFERAAAAAGLRALSLVSRDVLLALETLSRDADWSVRLAAVEALAQLAERLRGAMREEEEGARTAPRALPLAVDEEDGAAPRAVLFVAAATCLCQSLPDAAERVQALVAGAVFRLELRPSFVAGVLLDVVQFYCMRPPAAAAAVCAGYAAVVVRSLVAIESVYSAASAAECVSSGVLAAVLALCRHSEPDIKAQALLSWARLTCLYLDEASQHVRSGYSLSLCEYDVTLCCSCLWDIDAAVRKAASRCLGLLLLHTHGLDLRMRFTYAGGSIGPVGAGSVRTMSRNRLDEILLDEERKQAVRRRSSSSLLVQAPAPQPQPPPPPPSAPLAPSPAPPGEREPDWESERTFLQQLPNKATAEIFAVVSRCIAERSKSDAPHLRLEAVQSCCLLLDALRETLDRRGRGGSAGGRGGDAGWSAESVLVRDGVLEEFLKELVFPVCLLVSDSGREIRREAAACFARLHGLLARLAYTGDALFHQLVFSLDSLLEHLANRDDRVRFDGLVSLATVLWSLPFDFDFDMLGAFREAEFRALCDWLREARAHPRTAWPRLARHRDALVETLRALAVDRCDAVRLLALLLAHAVDTGSDGAGDTGGRAAEGAGDSAHSDVLHIAALADAALHGATLVRCVCIHMLADVENEHALQTLCETLCDASDVVATASAEALRRSGRQNSSAVDASLMRVVERSGSAAVERVTRLVRALQFAGRHVVDWLVRSALALRDGGGGGTSQPAQRSARARDSTSAQLGAAKASAACLACLAELRVRRQELLEFCVERARDPVHELRAAALRYLSANADLHDDTAVKCFVDRVAFHGETDDIKLLCCRALAAWNFRSEVLLEFLVARALDPASPDFEEVVEMVRAQRHITPALVKRLIGCLMRKDSAARATAARALETLVVDNLRTATHTIYMFSDPLCRAFLFDALSEFVCALPADAVPYEWRSFLAKTMTRKRDELTTLLVLLLSQRLRGDSAPFGSLVAGTDARRRARVSGDSGVDGPPEVDEARRGSSRSGGSSVHAFALLDTPLVSDTDIFGVLAAGMRASASSPNQPPSAADIKREHAQLLARPPAAGGAEARALFSSSLFAQQDDGGAGASLRARRRTSLRRILGSATAASGTEPPVRSAPAGADADSGDTGAGTDDDGALPFVHVSTSFTGVRRQVLYARLSHAQSIRSSRRASPSDIATAPHASPVAPGGDRDNASSPGILPGTARQRRGFGSAPVQLAAVDDDEFHHRMRVQRALQSAAASARRPLRRRGQDERRHQRAPKSAPLHALPSIAPGSGSSVARRPEQGQ